MLRDLNPGKDKVTKGDCSYYIMTKEQEQTTSRGAWGSYDDWNKLPDWERFHYDFAREWDALVKVKNNCQLLVGGCQLLWPQNDQHLADEDVMLHALTSLLMEHWKFIFQLPRQVGQKDLPVLLMPYYYYGFRQLLQTWQNWRG